MLAPEFLMPLVLAALIIYTLDSARMIKELKNHAEPAARAAFFAGKMKRQFLAVLLLPRYVFSFRVRSREPCIRESKLECWRLA